MNEQLHPIPPCCANCSNAFPTLINNRVRCREQDHMHELHEKCDWWSRDVKPRFEDKLPR